MDRTRYIGGSDIAGILSVSKWKTPIDVYNDKLGKEKELSEDQTKLFERGHKFESKAFELYLEKIGGKKEDFTVNEVVFHKEHSFLAAQIDAISDKINVELKTVGRHQLKAWLNDWEATIDGQKINPPKPVGGYYLPIDYFLQVQWGMLLAGKERCDVFCVSAQLDELDWSVKFNSVLFKIEADKELQEFLLKKAVDFWRNHVLAKSTPPPSSKEELNAVLTRFADTVVEVGDSLEDLAWNITTVRDDIKSLNKKKDVLENEVRKMLVENHCNSLTWNGKAVFSVIQSVRVGIDAEKLRQEFLSIFEKVRLEKPIQTLYVRLP